MAHEIIIAFHEIDLWDPGNKNHSIREQFGGFYRCSNIAISSFLRNLCMTNTQIGKFTVTAWYRLQYVLSKRKK